MFNRLLRYLVIILFSLFVSCKEMDNNNMSLQNTNEVIGFNAPEIELAEIYNKPDKVFPTLNLLKGNIVILDFWATWCKPCIAQFPKHNRLYKKYKEKGVKFLAITDDPKEKIENFLEKVETNFWVGRDDERRVFKKYNVSALPQIFILNRNGKIIFKGNSISEELIQEALETNTIRPKEEPFLKKTLTNGGFSPGQDPLYNAVDVMLNFEENGKNYRPNPKLIHHFIIRPSLNKDWSGKGWNQKGEHFGLTYYDGKLENIFQYLENLSSPIWVENKTQDTMSYDIIYWKKNISIDSVFREIEKELIDGLSIDFKSVNRIQQVNKIEIVTKNSDIITKENIKEGTEKAYTQIRSFITQLEIKTNQFFITDKESLFNKYIYNKGMEWNKLQSASPKEIIFFLEKKGLKISKTKQKIKTFEIFKAK